MFKEDTSINLLAYSIGAFLSQVLLLANPGNLFTDSRLFMFCGGSIFSEMDGRARDIMDKEAFERMEYYFTHSFIERTSIPETFKNDFLEHVSQIIGEPAYLIFVIVSGVLLLLSLKMINSYKNELTSQL